MSASTPTPIRRTVDCDTSLVTRVRPHARRDTTAAPSVSPAPRRASGRATSSARGPSAGETSPGCPRRRRRGAAATPLLAARRAASFAPPGTRARPCATRASRTGNGSAQRSDARPSAARTLSWASRERSRGTARARRTTPTRTSPSAVHDAPRATRERRRCSRVRPTATGRATAPPIARVRWHHLPPALLPARPHACSLPLPFVPAALRMRTPTRLFPRSRSATGIDCGTSVADSVEHAEGTCSGDTKYGGDICVATCEVGYLPAGGTSGGRRLRCGGDGKWEGSPDLDGPFSCQRKRPDGTGGGAVRLSP